MYANVNTVNEIFKFVVSNLPIFTHFFIYLFHRIERLWRDVYMCVSNIFYCVLHTLEEEGHLDLTNEIHLFCCHYVFIPRLQVSLDVFRDGWDNHPLSSEQNLSPNQLWEVGQMLCPVPDPAVSNVCFFFFILQLCHQHIICSEIRLVSKI